MKKLFRALFVFAIALVTPWLVHGDDFELKKQILEEDKKAYLANPENIELALKYAGSLLDLNRYEDAELIYDKILENSPQEIEALLGASRLALLQEKYSKALTLADKILQEEPESIDAFLIKAQVSLWQNNYDESEALYKKILEIEPANNDALLGLSYLWLAKGDYLKALEWNQKLIEKNPQDYEAQVDRAMIFESQGDVKSALEIYDDILKNDPNQIQASVRKVLLLGFQNRLDEARLELKKVLALRGGEIEAYLTLGQAYGRTRQLQKSIELYQKIIEEDPNNVQAIKNLALIYLDLNQLNDAEETINQAKEAAVEYDPKIYEIVDQINKARRPEVEVRYLTTNFNDYDPVLKQKTFKIFSSSQIVRVIQPLDKGGSFEVRHRRNRAREENLVTDEVDLQIKSRAFSTGYSTALPNSFFFGSLLEFAEHTQDGRGNFRLNDDKDFYGGYAFLSQTKGALSHSVSFSRDSFFLQRLTPNRAAVAHLETTTYTAEYDFTRNWKVIGHLENRNIEFQRDRQESRVEVQYRPELDPTLILGAQYQYITQETESNQIIFFRKFNSYLNDTFFSLIDGRIKYDSHARIWEYRITPTFSYELQEGLRLVTEFDFLMEDENDRDEFQKYEAFISYKF